MSNTFITYRDMLIWPTTHEDGDYYCEIVGADGADARDTADAPTFSTQALAVAEARRWIDRHLAEVRR